MLGGIGGFAAGISLLLLLYIQTKPLVNRWAARRYLHLTYTLELHDLLTPEQARRLSWRYRLRHRRRRWGHRCYQRLMTLVQRVKAPQFIDAFETARSRMVDAWAPDDVEFPSHLTEQDRGIVLEAAAISHVREQKQRMRRHRVSTAQAAAGPDSANDAQTTTSAEAAASRAAGAATLQAHAASSRQGITSAECALRNDDLQTLRQADRHAAAQRADAGSPAGSESMPQTAQRVPRIAETRSVTMCARLAYPHKHLSSHMPQTSGAPPQLLMHVERTKSP